MPDYLYPFLHVMSSYYFPMGTDSRLPNLPPLGAPSSYQILTTLSIDGFVDVNNMKIDNPPDCSVTLAVVVHTPHPRTPSLQADDATLIEDKSTLQTHANYRVGVLKIGTYSSSLLRGSPRSKQHKLGSVGCTGVHSLRLNHCHNNEGDNNGKGPQKRLHR